MRLKTMFTSSMQPKNNRSRARRAVVLTISWGCVLACAVTIFILSHETATQSAAKSSGVIAMLFARLGITLSSHFVRKAAHALEYLGLSLLLYNAYAHSFRAVQPALTLLTAILYAAGDEIHQYFILGRACQMRDVFVDTVGAVFGVLCCTAAYWVFKKYIQSILKKKGT